MSQMSQMSQEIISLHICLVPLSIFFKVKNIYLQYKTAGVRCLDIFVLGVSVSSVKFVKLTFASMGIEAAKKNVCLKTILCVCLQVSVELQNKNTSMRNRN